MNRFFPAILVLASFFSAPFAHAVAASSTPAKVEFASTNVSTAAYTQVVASLAKAIKGVMITNISTNRMILAVGASGSESDQLYISAGASTAYYPLVVSGSNRISIKSLDSLANTGSIVFDFFFN